MKSNPYKRNRNPKSGNQKNFVPKRSKQRPAHAAGIKSKSKAGAELTGTVK